MARTGVAISRLQDARDMLVVSTQEFADEGEPENALGLFDDALMCCHEAATAIGLALDRYKSTLPTELELGEDIFDDDEQAEG